MRLNKNMKLSRRPNDTSQEFFKRTVSAQIHTIGAFSVPALAILLLPKAMAHSPALFWSCLVFLLTGFAVLYTSSVYHFLSDGLHMSDRLELFFERLDHFCIYLFIAGTYTPVLYVIISEPWKSVLLTLVWSLAFLGIFYTQFKIHLPKALQARAVYVSLFVLLGWTLLIRATEAFSKMSASQLSFLILGGGAYTLGAVIYTIKKPNPVPKIFGYHEIWHALVLAGAGFHFAMIYDIVLHAPKH